MTMTSAPEVSRQTAFLALQMLLLQAGASLAPALDEKEEKNKQPNLRLIK